MNNFTDNINELTSSKSELKLEINTIEQNLKGKDKNNSISSTIINYLKKN
jgi:hypothetical protein